MNNLIEETLDDGSIVVVSTQSIGEEMETENSFTITPRFVPGLSESQQFSDSTHKQLQDILRENNELRDSLHKNNTEMRQLLGAFRDFQDKALQSRALHKQKIDSMWKESQQLQQDKEKMCQEYKDLQDQLKIRDVDIQKLQGDLVEVRNACSGLENEVETTKENLKRSEVTILTITSQVKEQESEVALLKLEKEKLFNQNEALIEQLDRKNSAGMNRQGSSDADDMGFSFVNQPEIVAALGDATLQKKLEEEETRCKELSQIIVQQKEQLETLEKALSSRPTEEAIHEAEVAERFFQIQKFSNVKTPSYIFQDFEDRYQSIGQQLGACEERLQHLKFEDSSSTLQDGLKQEVELLKQLLEQERLEKVMEKKYLEERIEQLTIEYRQRIASWEMYESSQMTKGRQNEALNAIEKRQHQEQLDELMAKNVSLEEENQAKDSELTRLKRQITMLNTETEQMPILRAQVEVYRQDFSKEREEKGKAETIASQLRQEVSAMQAQVSELRDELSALHDHQRQELSFVNSGPSQQGQSEDFQASAPTEDVVIPRGFRSSHQTYRSTDDDRSTSRKRRGHHSRHFSPPVFEDRYSALSTENTFECPRCKMTYSTVNAVENHLEACLSENNPYP